MNNIKFLKLILLFLIQIFFHAEGISQNDGKYKLIAHRGGYVYDGLIENSIPALKKAIDRGYWMVEVDIRETKDGVPIINHDKDFKKIFGVEKLVNEMSLEEIKRLKIQGTNISPLTLAEYLEATNREIAILLDVKDNHNNVFYETIKNELAKYGLLNKTYVAWSSEAREYFKNIPTVKIGIDSEELSVIQSKNSTPSGSQIFLVENSVKVDSALVEYATSHDILLIVTINEWHFRNSSTPMIDAQNEINRMLNFGINIFQIDVVYEKFLK